MLYSAAYLIHISCVIITINFFIFRFILLLFKSPLLKTKFIKIAPHINDTFLFFAGLTLAYFHGFASFVVAKVVAIPVYVFFGMRLFKRSFTLKDKMINFILSMLCVTYIVCVALTKNPLLFL